MPRQPAGTQTWTGNRVYVQIARNAEGSSAYRAMLPVKTNRAGTGQFLVLPQPEGARAALSGGTGAIRDKNRAVME